MTEISQAVDNFIRKQQAQNVPMEQIEESIFIAFNVSLVKTLKELEDEVPEEKIRELAKKFVDLRKTDNKEEVEKLLSSNLNGHKGVYKLFADNLNLFLNQL